MGASIGIADGRRWIRAGGFTRTIRIEHRRGAIASAAIRVLSVMVIAGPNAVVRIGSRPGHACRMSESRRGMQGWSRDASMMEAAIRAACSAAVGRDEVGGRCVGRSPLEKRGGAERVHLRRSDGRKEGRWKHRGRRTREAWRGGGGMESSTDL